MALTVLAGSRDRGEADRARAVLLTLSGWTVRASPRRSACATTQCGCGAAISCAMVSAALEATVAPGPAPVKSEAALRVVAPLLEAPVADRPN